MRLINSETLELEDFHGETPSYAILSHIWEEEEVSLQEYRQPDLVKGKNGYDKLLRVFQLTRHVEIPYVWADTCCI
jgi:hypothetical protein